MIRVRFDTKQVNKILNNLIEYSDGFLAETKAQQGYVNRKVANTSVNAFYEYLDGVARMHPGMLHHVYEWGQTGSPLGRLVDLSVASSSDGSIISADFLQSEIPSPGSNDVFYNKAVVMEEGITVTIQRKQAEALFFEIDGVEYFRTGPIVVMNPGGAETRGSFVRVFEDFYNNYFTKVYLKAIKFYEHFESPKEYQRNFKRAVKGGSARSMGKMSALSWLAKLPGDDQVADKY